MVQKIKPSFLIMLILITTIPIFLTSTTKSQGKSNSLGINVGAILEYNFTYTGSLFIGFSNIEQFTLTVDNILDNTITFSYEDDLSIRRIREVNANETLWNLPLGTNNSYLTFPPLADVVCPIAVITSDNWLENILSWAGNTDPYSVSDRYAIHDLSENYAGTWREAHILNGTILQHHFGNDVYGDFNITYSDQSGILLGMNAEFFVGYSGQTIKFNIELIEHKGIVGLSLFVSIPIILSSTFGLQWIVSLILVAIIYYRNKLENVDYEEDEVIPEEEIKIPEIKTEPQIPIVPPSKNLPEDYNFIYKCPFCNADIKDKDKICPECGGKR
ncbi:MAG TPA: zinc ribbon domain-containing protein [candidate division Zixibacteria bacterium]|nr:zinc ribbon domain-containing protein [candidate division Zixibacteria bacterium]